ncbi:RagB/SusD family nutrient uptake outer membrane protein [Chitinophagaceae bacterium LB-8]|uniref:RagB/SusD family nutrient uptake outer membrane protein n=2 Tax=Paraflavisolibacter caeni TaxID=2982496 RepID=A0A9X3BHZ2_9BACT|nr:RagB/SusD family nutrient uptake outer membrane protein [Paraflavisolibacter caeni]
MDKKSMKRIISLSVFFSILFFGTGCKKFLSLDPPNALSGNNFWKSKTDVENFTNGMYEQFRKAVARENMKADNGSYNFPFFAFAGEVRGGMTRENPSIAGTRPYIGDLSNNSLKSLFIDAKRGSYNWYQIFNVARFSKWEFFYKVIAAANIAVDRVDGVPGLTDAEKKQYKAEAIFLRNMSYFLMVRQWGDVAYYTDAYHTAPLKRMPMVDVLKNVKADMQAVKNDLPWTYSDPVFVAVRGMRGSAIALLMHVDMWLASFDAPNAAEYYTDVDKLGDELRQENGGAYALLDLARNGEIFKGRSKEGLFEVPQNANYGESFGWSYFYDFVYYNRLNPSQSGYPYVYYDATYLKAIYPDGESDKRKTYWFDGGGADMYSGSGKSHMTKFYVSLDPKAIDGTSFDASQIIFRYTDAILLQAEALANLGNEQKALSVVNIVRDRAAAAPLTSTGDVLKNDIFFERCRELIGEGHYWYDIVRTRRIIDPAYKFGYHCTVEQYKAGAWTWPINKSALTNNPLMTLNNYWE